MRTQSILIGLNVLLWVFFAYRFVRMFRRHRMNGGTALLAWTIQLFCYLVCLFTVASIEQQLDNLAGGLPVILYVRSILVILTAYLYALLMSYAHPSAFQLNRGLMVGVPSLIVVLIIFFGIAQRLSIPVEHQSIIVKSLRDALMAAWLVTYFIPAAVVMWKEEQHRLMKTRDLLMIIFFGSFFAYCCGSLLQSFSSVFVPNLLEVESSFTSLLTYACLLLFLLLLLPFRIIRLFFYPGRLFLYLRLKHVRNTVVRNSDISLFDHRLSVNILRPDQLEVAIYEATIDILDYYPGLSSSVNEMNLADRIEMIVKESPRYAELVRALALVL